MKAFERMLVSSKDPQSEGIRPGVPHLDIGCEVASKDGHCFLEQALRAVIARILGE
jgi:hypothetical protein